jgi:hypothetical protein
MLVFLMNIEILIPKTHNKVFYIFIKTLFTRELPGSDCRGHNELIGGLDLCIFARRTEIDVEPTPDPAV